MPNYYYDDAVYDADLVWIAAFMAQRMNNGYVKADDAIGMTRANSQLVREILRDHLNRICDEDRELAQEARQYYRGFTFRLLQGQINNFDLASLQAADKDQVNNRELNIIASLPSGFLRHKEKQRVDAIINNAKGGLVGTVGERVDLNIEVLRCYFSQTYLTNFVTALTDKDQIVYFGFKHDIEPKTKLSIDGKVKRHNGIQTQLNYVTIKGKS